MVGDSTDFQQTLNTFVAAVATAATNFNTALAAEPYLTRRTLLIAGNEAVDVQVTLEKSNCSSGLRTYTDTLTDNQWLRRSSGGHTVKKTNDKGITERQLGELFQ